MTKADPDLLTKAMDLLLDTVCILDSHGRFVYLSASCETLLGYTPAELIGSPMIDLVYPEDRERTLAAAQRVMSGNSHIHFENRYVRKDGGVVDIMWSARWSEEHQLRIAVARDITALNYARRKQEALYQISEAAFAAADLQSLYAQVHHVLVALMPADLLLVVSRDGAGLAFPYCSVSLTDDERRAMASHPLFREAVAAPAAFIRAAAEGGAPLAIPGMSTFSQLLLAPLMTPDGSIGALVMARGGTAPLYTEADGELLQYVCTQVASAIERKQAERHLQHMATHDPLTDLPNRTLFNDRLDVALERARRDGEILALLYVDLDDFKAINDCHGHDVGDAVLRELAMRLSGAVRGSDTIARIGGDEFCILLVNIAETGAADAVVDKVRRVASAPYRVEGISLALSVSVGVAVYPHQGTDKQELLRRADMGMYSAKRAG